jgi:uncharacterized protein YidB (DUF937 family)
MGLMDMVGGLLGKKAAPKSGNGLLDALLPMLMKGGAMGGMAGLVGKFSGAGLGAKTDSWVGTGPNEDIHPDEVESALGKDMIGQLASKAGVSHDEAKGGLASMLPNLVNQMTPGGSVPGAGGLGKMMKGLDFGKILGGMGR